MKPTVGRIVHYTNLGDKDGVYPPEQQAAIITGTHKSLAVDKGVNHVDLVIFYKTGIFNMSRVPFSEKYECGHWSWPTLLLQEELESLQNVIQEEPK